MNDPVTNNRSPVDRARDVLAAQIEAEFPGLKVTHSVMGWQASRNGQNVCRAQSAPALRAILPYVDFEPKDP